MARRAAELPTPLTLLVLNADVTVQASEDEIRRYVLSFSKKGLISNCACSKSSTSSTRSGAFVGKLNRSPDRRRRRVVAARTAGLCGMSAIQRDIAAVALGRLRSNVDPAR